MRGTGRDLHNPNSNKKNNSIVTATTVIAFLSFGAILLLLSQSADGSIIRQIGSERSAQAPAVVSGDNIYLAWWTNNTENGNQEVMFRSSTDGGATFSDRINLSNTTDSDSWRVEIAGEGETVVVSWWETNQTSDIPVARISTDAGETFGPMLRLGANGTVSSETTTAAATADTTTNTNTNDDGGDDEATATTVSIVPGSSELTDDAYQPNPIEVTIDDTLTWTNDDIAPHTVTSGESGQPDGEFDSGIMSTGATFEHTFTEAGEYPYFCTLHPNMVGTVSVN